jgi:hypothetical protein
VKRVYHLCQGPGYDLYGSIKFPFSVSGRCPASNSLSSESGIFFFLFLFLRKKTYANELYNITNMMQKKPLKLKEKKN